MCTMQGKGALEKWVPPVGKSESENSRVVLRKGYSSNDERQGPEVLLLQQPIKAPIPGTSGNSGRQVADFLLNNEAILSMVNRPPTECLQHVITVTGISGSPESQFFLKPLECGRYNFKYKIFIYSWVSNSTSGKGLAVQTSCSDHFLSLRTTAPPAGPSRAHLAVPCETMWRRRKATLDRRNWESCKSHCVGCWKAKES